MPDLIRASDYEAPATLYAVVIEDSGLAAATDLTLAAATELCNALDGFVGKCHVAAIGNGPGMVRVAP